MYIIERAKNYTKRFFMFLENRKGIKDKVVFESFSGQSYSDNPRAISERFHEVSPKTEIVWLFTDPEKKRSIVPPYVRVEKRCTKTMIREYGTARWWINNFCMQEFMYKGKGQIYIQTWHGDRPFKKVIYESSKLNFKNGEIRENKICDLCVAGSAMGEHVYRKAFRYTGKILRVGSPRADILIKGNPQRVQATKKKLGIPLDVGIVMYAPTFRDKKGLQSEQDMHVIDFQQLLKKLEKKYNIKWYCLLLVHPSLKMKSIYHSDPQIINVSLYEDMTDLMLIADMLITDYSSSAGDFVLQDKPLLLYQYDLAEYEKDSRELHFKMQESPFWSAQTEEELFYIIQKITQQDIIKNCKDILDFYGSYESGHAADAVCEYMLTQKDKL